MRSNNHYWCSQYLVLPSLCQRIPCGWSSDRYSGNSELLTLRTRIDFGTQTTTPTPSRRCWYSKRGYPCNDRDIASPRWNSLKFRLHSLPRSIPNKIQGNFLDPDHPVSCETGKTGLGLACLRTWNHQLGIHLWNRPRWKINYNLTEPNNNHHNYRVIVLIDWRL